MSRVERISCVVVPHKGLLSCNLCLRKFRCGFSLTDLKQTKNDICEFLQFPLNFCSLLETVVSLNTDPSKSATYEEPHPVLHFELASW